MSYNSKQRNDAILLIGKGKADFKNISFYEELAGFNWVTIQRQNGIVNKIELTYSGKDLFKRLDHDLS